VIALSSDRLLKALPSLSSDERVPVPVRALLLEAREQLAALQARIGRCDVEIAAHARDSDSARRVREVLGVGVLTASAFAATVSDPTLFRQGRQLGAWLGLTPRQASSGGKTRLGDSSRRGDTYLRTLLVQGARSALQVALRTPPEKANHLQRWMAALYARKGYHKTYFPQVAERICAQFPDGSGKVRRGVRRCTRWAGRRAARALGAAAW
jgi:transposase